ncbi:ABC transporter substrate-binding protein [Parerythrobacter aestuarii]|uniref:ABC transporter substrate-binding protein n=1 Tax=Parerythrobacter aestuarii TaxID=3020909 RepID=UPI0024DECD2E|nr:ABC transporter substrate-binding protein [Parerythrobacter aestuarii]
MSCAGLLLAGCSSRADEGAVSVAVIGDKDDPFESGNRLSYAGQLVREATSEGLVAMDETGEVVPAIAERWIVTEDGLSFFFRIRGSDWPDGDELDAASVKASLERAIQSLEGTTLGLDLQKIDEIRVMADRVLEVRLRGPMPQFLQMLAQPELGLRLDGQGTGPMRRLEGDEQMRLQPIAPQFRGLPELRAWDDNVLDVVISGIPAQRAVDAFRNGELEIVLNGRMSSFPLAETGPLSSGTLRLDATVGLFGLSFRNARGLLATAERREALSMAIDRPRLLQAFNLAGWVPTTRIVAPGLPGDRRAAGERWTGQSLEERRGEARRRIAEWTSSAGTAARLSVSLPQGPGSNLLFEKLAEDFASIGVTLQRAQPGEAADLRLVDRLARYAGARWFLNQFNCDISQPVCSPDADVLVDQSLDAPTADEAANLLAGAEGAMNDAEVFIPFGAPIRWSLVRGGVGGFSENRWGRHPLFPLAIAPIS